MKTIEITNIKKLQNFKLEIPDNATFLLMKGANRTGKSTVEHVIRTLMGVKNDMVDPVTKGMGKGGASYKTTDVNGNPMTVSWIHEDGKDKFRCSIAKDGKINRVSAVNSIRDILGKHFRFTVQDIFNMIATSAGKKKFMDEFVLAMMTNDDREEYLEASIDIASNKNKETESNSYFKRRNYKSQADLLSAKLSNVPEWNDNKQSEYSKLEKERDTSDLEEEKDELKNDNTETLQVSHDIKRAYEDLIVSFEELIDRKVVVDGFDKNKLYDSVAERMLYLKQGRENNQKRINEIVDQIEEVENNSDRFFELKNELKLFEDAKDQRLELQSLMDKIEKLDAIIESKKELIEAILKRTKLPSNLVVDTDGNILLNGLRFDEMSVSDSEARLAVIELLSIINETHFVDIGDITVFDEKSKEKLLKIADDNECILIGQQVTNDDVLDFEILVK